MNEQRFENQFKFHYEKLFATKKDYKDCYERIKKKNPLIDKYNPAVLACACFYEVNKTPKDMENCIKYLSNVYEKMKGDASKKRGIMIDILRYYKLLTEE